MYINITRMSSICIVPGCKFQIQIQIASFRSPAHDFYWLFSLHKKTIFIFVLQKSLLTPFTFLLLSFKSCDSSFFRWLYLALSNYNINLVNVNLCLAFSELNIQQPLQHMTNTKQFLYSKSTNVFCRRPNKKCLSIYMPHDFSHLYLIVEKQPQTTHKQMSSHKILCKSQNWSQFVS